MRRLSELVLPESNPPTIPNLSKDLCLECRNDAKIFMSKHSTTKSYNDLNSDELQRVRDLDKAKANWFQHLNYISQCEDVGGMISDMVDSNEKNCTNQRKRLQEDAKSYFIAIEKNRQKMLNNQIQDEEKDKLEFYNTKWIAFYNTKSERKLQELQKGSDFQ